MFVQVWLLLLKVVSARFTRGGGGGCPGRAGWCVPSARVPQRPRRVEPSTAEPLRPGPAPGPAGLLPWRRGHGGQREAEAGGEAPEDAAGHDRPPAQPKVLRLRPAWPHLREHDGRLLRVYLLLRQPTRIKSTTQGEIYLHDNIHTTGD